MQHMLVANRQYFFQAWTAVRTKDNETPAYALARQDAIVSAAPLDLVVACAGIDEIVPAATLQIIQKRTARNCRHATLLSCPRRSSPSAQCGGELLGRL